MRVVYCFIVIQTLEAQGGRKSDDLSDLLCGQIVYALFFGKRTPGLFFVKMFSSYAIVQIQSKNLKNNNNKNLYRVESFKMEMK